MYEIKGLTDFLRGCQRKETDLANVAGAKGSGFGVRGSGHGAGGPGLGAGDWELGIRDLRNPPVRPTDRDENAVGKVMEATVSAPLHGLRKQIGFP